MFGVRVLLLARVCFVSDTTPRLVHFDSRTRVSLRSMKISPSQTAPIQPTSYHNDSHLFGDCMNMSATEILLVM